MFVAQKSLTDTEYVGATQAKPKHRVSSNTRGPIGNKVSSRPQVQRQELGHQRATSRELVLEGDIRRYRARSMRNIFLHHQKKLTFLGAPFKRALTCSRILFLELLQFWQVVGDSLIFHFDDCWMRPGASRIRMHSGAPRPIHERASHLPAMCVHGPLPSWADCWRSFKPILRVRFVPRLPRLLYMESLHKKNIGAIRSAGVKNSLCCQKRK